MFLNWPHVHRICNNARLRFHLWKGNAIFRPVCFVFKRAGAPRHFFNEEIGNSISNGSISRAPRQWPGSMEAITSVASVKYQAYSCVEYATMPGLEFHLWEGNAIFILQRALPLESVKICETFEGTKDKTSATEAKDSLLFEAYNAPSGFDKNTYKKRKVAHWCLSLCISTWPQSCLTTIPPSHCNLIFR